MPVLAAVSLMAAAGEPEPRSLTLMGGPIDTRRNPTQVNRLATSKPLEWFDTNLVHSVPAGYSGYGRRVYPGFLQHASFIAMNPVRHATSHWDFYQDLSRGAHGDADEHRRFYDEYNAMLDMAGRVLPGLRAHRVPAAPAAARPVARRRRTREAGRDHPHRRC